MANSKSSISVSDEISDEAAATDNVQAMKDLNGHEEENYFREEEFIVRLFTSSQAFILVKLQNLWRHGDS